MELFFCTRSLQNYHSGHSFQHTLKLSEMCQPGRWHKVCQQYDVFSQSLSFMQSTAEGSHDHTQIDSQKGNSDLISTNSSQCARRITLPVCTTEVSVRSLKSSLKYHLRGKREGRKKRAHNITQENTVLRIKELPQAKQNHGKSLNQGTPTS